MMKLCGQDSGDNFLGLEWIADWKGQRMLFLDFGVGCMFHALVCLRLG